MKTILAALGTIFGISALGAWVGYRNRALPSSGVAYSPVMLETRILSVFTSRSLDEVNMRAKYAAEAAKALGLPRTAEGLVRIAYPPTTIPLPTDETWPGTNQSVRAYIDEKRKQRKA